MHKAYYDEGGRNIYLCNEWGDFLTIHYPAYVLGESVGASMKGSIWRRVWMNFSDFGKYLQFWEGAFFSILLPIQGDVEMSYVLRRVDDFDFSGMKVIEGPPGKLFKLDFFLYDGDDDDDDLFKLRDISEISDEYFLLAYEYSCYTGAKFDRYLFPQEGFIEFYRQSVFYYSFLRMEKRGVFVSDLVAIERLRRLGIEI
jgi:hypothetical protein